MTSLKGPPFARLSLFLALDRDNIKDIRPLGGMVRLPVFKFLQMMSLSLTLLSSSSIVLRRKHHIVAGNCLLYLVFGHGVHLFVRLVLCLGRCCDTCGELSHQRSTPAGSSRVQAVQFRLCA